MQCGSLNMEPLINDSKLKSILALKIYDQELCYSPTVNILKNYYILHCKFCIFKNLLLKFFLNFQMSLYLIGPSFSKSHCKAMFSLNMSFEYLHD